MAHGGIVDPSPSTTTQDSANGLSGVPVAQEAREALHGALTIYPKHPDMDDTYYIGGAWAPACITARDKRFTDAELAAEYWHSLVRFYELPSSAQATTEARRYMDFKRFATLPPHDQETA